MLGHIGRLFGKVYRFRFILKYILYLPEAVFAIAIGKTTRCSKPLDLIAVEAPFEGIVYIIQCSVVTELGGSDRPLHSPVFTVVELALNQVRHELVLSHFLFDSVLKRGLKSVVHTKQRIWRSFSKV